MTSFDEWWDKCRERIIAECDPMGLHIHDVHQWCKGAFLAGIHRAVEAMREIENGREERVRALIDQIQKEKE